jgi:hypothetical protein
MQGAAKGVAALSGTDVLVSGPSSPAVEVLKEQGFLASDTFRHFMETELPQGAARGTILSTDDAGSCRTGQMRWTVDSLGVATAS